MLLNLKDLCKYVLVAEDGEIGRVHDLFFEDDSWIIRYLVANTSHWLPGRKVLLTPNVIQKLDGTTHSLRVRLTKEQVKESPDIAADLPVSRQRELELHQHYGWPVYWVPAGTGPWTMFVPPPGLGSKTSGETQRPKGDPHLRSVREVTGYHLKASDGGIGHVSDFIADDTTWTIRYLVVYTRNWLPGRQVLIPPQWLVQDIDWAARKVEVSLTRESIRNSPKYDPITQVNREVEKRLYDYYGRPAYWAKRDIDPEFHSQPVAKLERTDRNFDHD